MPNNHEIYDFYELITKAFKKIIDIWQEGEGQMEVSVHDDKGRVRAKISGGTTERVGEKT